MKVPGIVRRVDALGGIVLLKEIGRSGRQKIRKKQLLFPAVAFCGF